MTGSDPLVRLADELGHLGQRLAEVSVELRRVGQTTTTTAVAPPVQPQPVAPPPVFVPEAWPQQAAQPPYQPTQPVYQPPQPAYQPQQPQPLPQWPLPPQPPHRSLFDRLSEDGAGSKLLAWAGGAVTLLGVVLLLVLAVQQGYLGPLARVIGGAALALVLIGIGLWLHRTPTARTGAFALAATGIAALYLDVVAATTIYGYLPSGGGLAVGLLVAGGGLLLAMRWDSALLAIGVVVACAICAPILTAGFTPLLVAFLLVLKMAATPVQIRRQWSWLAVAAGVPPLLAIVLTTASVVNSDDKLMTAGVALLAAFVGVGAAVITVRRRPDDVFAVAMLVASPIPALLTTVLLDRYYAAGLAGVVAVLMLGLWLVRPPVLAAAFTTASAAVGVFALFQTTAIALDGSTRTATVLAEALLMAYLAAKLRSKGPLLASAIFGGLGLVMAVAFAVPPRLLLDDPKPWSLSTSGDLVAGLLTALVLGLLTVALPWAASRLGLLGEPGEHPLAWIGAGVVLLYAASGFVLCGALLVSQTSSGFLFGHTVVTVSWTVAALFLLVRGIDIRVLRVSGLVLVGAALAKLVLFDLAALEGMARVAAFIGAGLVLLTAGTRYAKLVATRRISTNS
jgi:uncharacterized membrane protein